jgi:hypothetical protein
MEYTCDTVEQYIEIKKDHETEGGVIFCSMEVFQYILDRPERLSPMDHFLDPKKMVCDSLNNGNE